PDEPEEGHLDQDFARFRAQRLRESGKLKLPAPDELAAAPPPAPAPPPPAPEPAPEAEGELLFGTTSREPRELSSQAREYRETLDDEPDAAPARATRRPSPPLPSQPTPRPISRKELQRHRDGDRAAC